MKILKLKGYSIFYILNNIFFRSVSLLVVKKENKLDNLGEKSKMNAEPHVNRIQNFKNKGKDQDVSRNPFLYI